MSMAESVRLRVVFRDAGLLKRSQQRRGLQRCLLQLRPDVATIADLAAQLLQKFGLHRSCPHGLIISMDDFVLPPFESTSILKDDDMIMINKNGVVFEDAVKFCSNQYHQQVLQSGELAHSNQKLSIMDEIIDPTVISKGDEDDMVLCNGSAVRMGTPQSEKIKRCKRKRSNELQSSDNNLARKHKGATSNETVDANCKKKHANKFRASDSTLENKNFQADSQGDKGHLTLAIRHKETSSGEMIHGKQNKKHFRKLQCSDDTLTIEDSQGNSQRDEHDDGLLGIIAHKESTSKEMMNSNHKRKRLSKLQASNTLTSKDSQADSQGDEEDLGLPNEKKSQEETPSCEMTNTKRKKKHSHRHQDSNNTLAIANSQGAVDGNDMDLPNRSEAPAETPSDMTNVVKRIHSNKLEASEVNKAETENTAKLVTSIKDIENTSSEHNEQVSYRKAKKTVSCKDILSNGIGRAVADVENEGKGEQKISRTKKAETENPAKLVTSIKDIGNTSSEHNERVSNKKAKKTVSCKDILSTGIGSAVADVENEGKGEQKISRNESKGILDVHASTNDTNGDERKVSSRSARRKKLKKIFYRTHGIKKKMTHNKEVDHSLPNQEEVAHSSQNLSMPISHNLIEIQNPERDNHEEPSDYSNTDQNTDVNIDIVPIIVRPGHIRFESSDERSVREHDPVDTFQWNGTTSKKKGQKWGMEKSYNKWNNDTFYQLCSGESDTKGAEVVEVSNEKAVVVEVESHKDSIAEQVEPVIECEENSILEELETGKQLIDYVSFLPLTRLPKDGDLLVYRVVELSSSWCPELSASRVGRVSSYDPCTSKIILLPLPEYPVVSEETPDDGQESVSLYEEDGTLEIDFSSLVDVRLFKSPESEEATLNTAIEETQKDAPVNNQESEGCSNPTANEQHLGDAWEAIQRALDEKKAQLEKRNKFEKRRGPSRSAEVGPWSYKALRRNAVGPTLAMLRSSNGD